MTTLLSMWILAAALALAPAQEQPVGTPTLALEQPAPPIKGTLLDGAAFDLATLRGQVVLVDFWATWCEPCKLSLPRYAALERKLAGKGFSILTVSVDEDAEALNRFVAVTHLVLKVLHDSDAKVGERYAPAKMPTAYLVGRDGKNAWVHESFVIGDEAKVEAAVERALAKPAH